MVLTLAVIGLLGAAIAPPASQTPAHGSTILGRVDVSREARTAVARPDVADLGAHDGHGLREPTARPPSVVYLELRPPTADAAPVPGRAVLDQRDEAFVPSVLAITVGSTVEFPNSDPTYHNVFSLSKPKRFDLGRYPRGQSRSVRFDKPGIVRVFCELHSHMSAWILVFAHPYFATTDLEGRFRIDGVPSGSYQLAVWNAGSVRIRRELTVPAEGETVVPNLRVR